MRNGTENLQRLIGDATLCLLRLVLKRPHIMQTVCQLNKNNANVLRHRYKHFAIVLILLLFLGAELDLLKLRKTVYQHGTGFAKFRPYGLQIHDGVFHNIMKKRGDNRQYVHLHIYKDISDRNGMQNVRLSRFPNLSVMGLFCEIIGFLYAYKVLLFHIGGCLLD
ncbi:hypothetical protein D3C78_739890 [compost metagenome]